MRRSVHLLLLTVSLSGATASFAANERRIKPSEYQEMTEEEKAAAKARARNRMTAWSETATPPEYQFPWMPLVFTVVAFSIAAPFAWGAWKRYSNEQREVNAAAATPAVPVRNRTKTAD